MENKKTINLFWTGGWDSTFRLLQLLVVYKKKVQPYYIVDKGRMSCDKEIATIEKLRVLIFTKYPFAKNLLLPVKFAFLSEIRPNKKITSSYRRVNKLDKIGIQYEWLSRFCWDNNLFGMEMCNETSIYPEDNLVKRVFGQLRKVEDAADYHYVINNQEANSDTFVLFQYFKLVLFNYTKLDMQELSKQYGFYNIMEQTWFCFFPMLNSIPCGKCHPCKTVYREGLQWRLPAISKIRHWIWPFVRKVVEFLNIK